MGSIPSNYCQTPAASREAMVLHITPMRPETSAARMDNPLTPGQLDRGGNHAGNFTFLLRVRGMDRHLTD